jgi:uncharacterized protein involved in exopolysaccharide biosynthesis
MIVKPSVPNIAYVLFRHKWLMLLVFIGSVAIAVAYCAVTTPLFEAESDLYVKFGRDSGSAVDRSVGTAQTSGPDRKNVINSLIRLITSDTLVEQVIQQVGLDKLYPKIAASHPSQGTPLGAAVRHMVNHDLTVTSPRDADIIEVKYTNPDPELAAKTAGLLVDQFVQSELKLLRDPQSTFLQDQFEQSKKLLLQAQTNLDQFHKESGISSLDEERSLLLKERADIEGALYTNQVQTTELQRRQQALQSASSATSIIQLIDNDRDAAMDATRGQLVALQLHRQDLLSNYRPDSQAIVDIDRQIHELNLQYLQRVDAQLSALRDSERTLTTQRADLNRRISTLDGQENTLNDLNRQYQIADLNYRTYNQNVEEARISDDLNRQKITTIAMIQSASVPDTPKYPRPAIIVPVGAAVGILFGFLLAFFRETFDEGLNLPVQVEDVLGLPVLASLPRLRTS